MNPILEAKVVKVTKPRKQDVFLLTIQCPYCNKKHTHGGGTHKDNLLLGHRSLQETKKD